MPGSSTITTSPLQGTRPLWDDTLPSDERVVTQPLAGDRQVDVAIVGAGFTGLWTAHHLLRRDPALRVVVVEREQVGFGASGRNGGWCSALLPMGLSSISARHGAAAATRMQRAMHDNVGDVVRSAGELGVGEACHQGGTISLARTDPQHARLVSHLDELRRFGVADGIDLLDADAAHTLCQATGVRGGLYTPHCATVHPARLVHALARDVLARGATIATSTSVDSIEPGLLRTSRGHVRAEVVVRATEGYSGQFAGQRRSMLPIYSLMVATEPLPQAVWDEIGLARRPTFNDARRLIIYGQRTTDDRLAFGGRGAPYHFGSAVRPGFDADPGVAVLLRDALIDLFPILAGVAFTHHWGGVLAAARDWHCFVSIDRRSGLAAAGNYVGDGVSTTHLAGRTLAALITNSDDDADRELVRLPWVGHRSRRWEPEPARWIGVNAIRVLAARSDQIERRTDRASRLGAVVDRVTGH